ncbi:MAG: peptide chain release factor N(5)-glutamine methyltransferase [Clostridiaceae bacterium]|nr:peptide chain release factor N(5)-glutamine methyltransferase [Clostridiaceae bacterium]
MTYGEAYKEGIRILRGAGIEAPANDAGVLLCHAAKCDRTFIYAHGDELLEDVTDRVYHQMLEKRAGGWPLQYLTGIQEFMSLTFEVQPGVLIPRQDTELLVEIVLEHCTKSKGTVNTVDILDLCTGSGCIAVSLAYHYPACMVTASDIMPATLKAASGNAKRNGVADRISFIQSDLFNSIPEDEYDVIVSNPPYIRTDDLSALQREVKDHEPVEALDGGPDGLHFYRSIIASSTGYLRIGGMLAFETGYDQAAEVAALMARDERYEAVRVFKDMNGIDRVVAGLRR